MQQMMIDYMLQFDQLNEQQVALIKSKMEEITLPKGGYFSEPGKVANTVGFLTEGVIRVCYYNKDGEEFTRCFIPANRFVADMNSFYNLTPCAEYVEAVTECRLLTLSRESYTELSHTIVSWNDIFSRITSKALMAKMSAARIMLTQDASTRYVNFLQQYPGLANTVPLSFIASFLGITQSSLSRIRKNIS